VSESYKLSRKEAHGLRTDEMSMDKRSLTVRHIEAKLTLVLIVDCVGRTLKSALFDATLSRYYGSN